jgi:hypothetical protein
MSENYKKISEAERCKSDSEIYIAQSRDRQSEVLMRNPLADVEMYITHTDGTRTFCNEETYRLSDRTKGSTLTIIRKPIIETLSKKSGTETQNSRKKLEKIEF